MTAVMKIIKETWENLPVWFIFGITSYTVFGYISLLKEPRPDYAMTFIIPYGMFLFYYYARFKADGVRDGMSWIRKYLVVAGITSAILVVVIAVARPLRFAPDWPAHFDRSIIFYEISNIIWTLLIAAHCLLFQGWKKFLLFYGVAFLYGMILESLGVTMGFFFEDHYHLYVPGFSAPVATMFGWSTIFYPCVFLLDGLRRGVTMIGNRPFPWLGIFVAVIAVCIDAVIDPFATDFGLWTWNRGYNPENSFYWNGVPLVNFISWFTAVFTFGIVYYFIELKKMAWDQIKKTKVMLYSLPLILLVAGVMEFSALGIIEGFGGPSWTILRQYYKDGMPMTRPPQKGKMPDNHNSVKP